MDDALCMTCRPLPSALVPRSLFTCSPTCLYTPILQPTDRPTNRYLATHLEVVREGASVHRLQADPAEVHAAVHALHLHPPTDQDITGDRSVSQSLRSKQHHAGWLAGCFEP